jgi:tetratricopeptide (TPR) repeat protein
MSSPDRVQAEALMTAQRFREAEALFARLRQADPGNDELAFRHAQVLHSLGKLEEAIPGYLQAMASDPFNPKPLNQLGLLLQEAGETQQALDLFQQALTLAPTDTEALYFLARAYSAQAQLDAARPLYERLEQIDPQDPVAPFSLGHDARQAGDLRQAQALLERARSLVRGQREPTLWVLEELIFLLSIGSAQQHGSYGAATEEYWRLARERTAATPATPPVVGEIRERLRVGILSADLGEHVVGTFLGAFLDGYRRDRLEVELIATKLRHETQAEELAASADTALTVHGLGVQESRALLRQRHYDVIVETAGFTHPAGLELPRLHGSGHDRLVPGGRGIHPAGVRPPVPGAAVAAASAMAGPQFSPDTAGAAPRQQYRCDSGAWELQPAGQAGGGHLRFLGGRPGGSAPGPAGDQGPPDGQCIRLHPHPIRAGAAGHPPIPPLLPAAPGGYGGAPADL